jgi:micrococcal nuclease
MLRPSLLALAASLLLAAGAAQAQSCSSFSTCEEAMRSLRSGNTRIDGDGDGIPCEALCRGYSGGGGSPGGGTSAPSQGPARIRVSPSPAPSQRVTPTVASGPVTLVSVGDGDTIRVKDRAGTAATIRVACIDAPETAQGQPGKAATESLRAVLAAGSLEIKVHTKDRYGRTVAEVFAGGKNAGVELVRRGDAFVYHQYLEGCDATAYIRAEEQAERARLGVWRWNNVQRPWEFRQRSN